MKLGISYTVFSGEELLPFAVNSIRHLADFISVVYQTTSYHGNYHDPLPTIKQCPVDKLIHFQPDITLPPKVNELNNRNIGLQASRDTGCTHHISSDVDELYTPEQFAKAKEMMDDCDCSVVRSFTYFKHPTYKITPSPKHHTPFIQSVNNTFDMETNFQFPVERTRKSKSLKVKLLEGVIMYHMSFVRKDIRSKLVNSSGNTGKDYDEFLEMFDKYQVGDSFWIYPDMTRRKTKLVEDIFNIGELT